MLSVYCWLERTWDKSPGGGGGDLSFACASGGEGSLAKILKREARQIADRSLGLG